MNLDNSKTQFIAYIKQKVRQAQYAALKAVNTQLIGLYWELGRAIAEKQDMAGVRPLFLRAQKSYKVNFLT